MIKHALSISCLILGGAALQSPREDSVVPPGLESFVPPSPALKRWAKFGRPSGAGFLADTPWGRVGHFNGKV